jgi:isoquinoline 1-oxidoreductase subunit alpha
MTSTRALTINGRHYKVEAPDGMPLLWVLRDLLQMRGTKFGCGKALCGACTVQVDNVATRSCVLPIEAANGKDIRTIEGLAGERLHPLQEAWLEHQVSQCGYCQSGQLMAAAALLQSNRSPSDKEIDAAMSGNLCRCGTYPRIKAAIKTAAERLRAGTEESEA